MNNKIPTIIHCLNNSDYDYVLKDFENLTKQEVWDLFTELVATYKPARQGTEFEYNYLQDFLCKLLQNKPLTEGIYND